MKWTTAIVLILLITSCSSPFKKKLIEADDMTINFLAGERPDSVYTYKIVHTTDTKAMEKLIDFIDKGTATNRQCPADGTIKFSNKDQIIQTITFTISDNKCRQFMINENGQESARAMSNDAADFLIGLREGRGF